VRETAKIRDAAGAYLIAEGCHGVTRYQPAGEKTMRMHAQTAVIENGFVHILESAPWLADYLDELAVFPNGKHDDQADSTAQFLDWFKTPFPSQNIFELYRREAQAAEQRRKLQPSKQHGRSAPWSGSPSRRNRVETAPYSPAIERRRAELG
jgi:hypothetical protein